MRSALSVAIAALLVTSLLTMAIATADPTADTPAVDDISPTVQPAIQPEDDGTAARLGLDDPAETTYTTPGPDLGTTLASHDDTMRNEWTIHEADYHWDDLSETRRAHLLEDLEDRLYERIDELEAREARAVESVATGDESADQLLRTVARHDREAAALVSHFFHLSDLSGDVDGTSIIPRTPDNHLGVYQGPVRSNVYDTISGVDQMDTTVIQVTESGAVLGSIDRSTYIREAVRFDNRDLSLPNQFDGDDVSEIDQFEEAYPWATEEGTYTINGHPSIQLYRLERVHAQGTLLSYLDGGTGEIFRENQQLNLNDLPQIDRGTWEEGDLNVSVNGTPGDELLKLTVRDGATGDPLDGTVLIDEQPVAELDAGEAWIVEPPAAYELVIETDAGTMTIDDIG
ncbi:DUF7096 domain-containing protein [Halovivax gelatinilyticus]|uniref:DUF7096 domain-containing protein n=1 Tax=Halovivax gelatinilyticus TaxID=2961597 RepID=UPI0020CA757A|nr:hypothetical protein [Halovivax gelatinilyticus]